MLLPLVLSLALSAGQAEGKPKLLVLDLAAAGGVEKELAGAMTEAVTSEVASRGFFSVISSKDIQTLLGMERQKQMVGCRETGSTCLAELGGAVGARFILTGTLARLGSASFQLSLQGLDSGRARPIGHATVLGADVAGLR